ncbi:hypothetical protein Tco_0810929, partial [Tanacetum coccineum]
SLEVIPSSKGTKVQVFTIIGSKIKEKERTKAEKDPTVAGTSYVPGAGIGRLSRAFLRILLLQMNSETLQQIYIPKWNVINDFSCDDPEFNVRAACQTCLSAEVKLRSEHNLRERKKFQRKCARQIDLLKEKRLRDCKFESPISLKGAEATEANHSSLKLSCDELSIKATSLKSQKDNLTDQYEVVQDEQVKILSDHVAKLDSKLMSMAVHLDEEFYPRFLTTIEYAAALGTAIGLAIEKGMQNGLKDASIACIMDSLRLDGPSAETSEVSRLQPAYEQLLLHIHRKEDNAVIGDTSLSDSLNVVHEHVQKASTSGVPATTATTTALSISITIVNVSSILPISVADYKDVPKFRRSYPCCPDLYAPLPSASVTSYGPSHLGPSFSPSFAWLASLFRYTRSPGLKLVLRTLKL